MLLFANNREGIHYMTFHKLSNAAQPTASEGLTLLMVGSYAPVHMGHFSSLLAAKDVVEAQNETISNIVLTPNSDSYVIDVKLKGGTGRWSFAQRVLQFTNQESPFTSPAFVDDISGARPPELTITETSVRNIELRLGVEACKVILVVGSDQVASMKQHINDNRAICVKRPGVIDPIDSLYEEQWFSEAVDTGRYIITEREHSGGDISSTDIRNELEITRSGVMLCD